MLAHDVLQDLWSLAGWTMVHFLWLGAIVAAFAFAGRVVLRNAAPNARYSFALVCLALITAMPFVAARLYEPSPSGRGQGEGTLASAASEFTRRGGSLPPSTTADANSPPLKGGARGGIPFDANARTTTASPTPPIIELHTPSSDVAATAATANSPPLKGGAGGGGIPNNASQPSTLNSQPSTVWPSTLNPRLSTLIPYLPWLWLIGTPLTFALLFTGLIGTRRLSRASTPITAGPIADALARLTMSLHITRRVTMAVCERVAAPVLIGIVRPMILLPPAALTGWSPDEIEMVLLHELAHIRRYDNVVNLAQRIIESLLFFHPAIWLISTWVRREREACCDAAVVTRTQQPHAYAELLLNIASKLSELSDPSEPGRSCDDVNSSEPGRPRPRPFPLRRGRGRPGSLPVSSPMAAGPLRTRIRHILQLEDDPMLITPKSLAITLATLLTAATLAFVYLPKIGQAEPSATEGTEDSEKKQEKSEAKSIEEPTPEPVLIPFNFVLKHDSAGKTRLYMNDQPVADDVVRDTFTRLAKFIDKLQVSLTVEQGIDRKEEMRVVDLLHSLGVKRITSNAARFETKPPKSEQSVADDWPKGVVFPSPKDGEISASIWQRLRLKLVPATSEELKAAGTPYGIRVRNEFSEWMVPHGKHPIILTKINDVSITSFDDLLKVCEQLNSSSDQFVTCTLMIDGKPFGLRRERNENVQPTQGTDSTAQSHSKFPALEDQKLADLAWKRLGLELEPIAADDLQRVKALGYDGGVKVTAGTAGVSEGGGFSGNPSPRIILPNDILVGLHVWPTINMKDVATILNRDDLAELNPLKFYVLRQKFATGPEGVAPRPLGDAVTTGRINVQLGAFGGGGAWTGSTGMGAAPIRGSAEATAPYPPPTAALPADGSYTKSLPATLDDTIREFPVLLAIFFSSKDTVPAKTYDEQLKVLGSRLNDARVGVALVDVARQAAVAARYRVKQTPTYLIFRDAKEVVRLSGAQSVETLHSTIAKMKTESIPHEEVPPEANKQSLRYDGKPFEEWRSVWKTELSTEKRTEAVKALAAFGRAGYGPEAAAAILDVAAEYDFHYVDNSPEGKLKQAVLDELTPEAHEHSLAKYWLPDLANRLQGDSKKWKWLTCNLLDRLRTDDKALLKIAQGLASVNDNGVRGSVIGVMVRAARANKVGLDESTRQLIDQSLESKVPEMVRTALFYMVSNPPPGTASVSQRLLLYQPAALPKLLFHADDGVRGQARRLIPLLDDETTTGLVDELVAILKDPSRQRDHIEAIRALGLLGKKAAQATPALADILKSSDDQPTLVATMVALARIAGRTADDVVLQNVHPQVVKQYLGIELTDDDVNALKAKIGGEDATKRNEFLERLREEEQQNRPIENTNLGGGGVY